jgi:deoxycytidine triphosphate deaminase
MVIGLKKLEKLVKEKKLVEGLSERELKNPEGAGFDLRIGEVHSITGHGFLGVTERKTTKAKTLLKYKKNKTHKFVLKSGEQRLVSTIEKVNLPDNITSNFWLRGTLYRSGIILSGGNIAPGYCGKLTVTFFNSGRSNVTIEMGARILHILFYQVDGTGSKYRGQWQGGRVYTKKKEKQV